METTEVKIDPDKRVKVSEDGGRIMILGALNYYGDMANETARILTAIAKKTNGLPMLQRQRCTDQSHLRAVLANYYHSIKVSHMNRVGNDKDKEPPSIYMGTWLGPDFFERVMEGAGEKGSGKDYHRNFMRSLLISLMKASSFFDELGKRYEGFDANSKDANTKKEEE